MPTDCILNYFDGDSVEMNFSHDDSLGIPGTTPTSFSRFDKLSQICTDSLLVCGKRVLMFLRSVRVWSVSSYPFLIIIDSVSETTVTTMPKMVHPQTGSIMKDLQAWNSTGSFSPIGTRYVSSDSVCVRLALFFLMITFESRPSTRSIIWVWIKIYCEVSTVMVLKNHLLFKHEPLCLALKDTMLSLKHSRVNVLIFRLHSFNWFYYSNRLISDIQVRVKPRRSLFQFYNKLTRRWTNVRHWFLRRLGSLPSKYVIFLNALGY